VKSKLAKNHGTGLDQESPTSEAIVTVLSEEEDVKTGNNLDTTWSNTTKRLYDSYHLLKILDHYDEVAEQLRRMSFRHGEDNILHFAIGRDAIVLLRNIIRYMESRNITLDIHDSQRRTALELAVRKDQADNVEIWFNSDTALALVNDRGQHLLHVAINKGVSQQICDALLTSGASPHEKDAHGRNALELAIRKDSFPIVELLLQYDSSLTASNARGETPLLLAIRSKASCSTCLALMPSEDVEESITVPTQRGQYDIALDVVIETLALCTDENKRRGWYRLLEHLLGRSVHLDPNAKVAKDKFRAFLNTLSAVSTTDSPPSSAAERCLLAFLHKGFSPFEGYDISGPGSVPPACSLLVTYSLLHASHCTIFDQIGNFKDTAIFGQELFYLLIDAAKQGYWPSDKPPVFTFLQALLQRDIRFSQGRNPLSLVLQQFPDNDPTQKREILEALMQYGQYKLTDESSAFGHPLDQLTRVPVPLRWDLAEILLSHDQGLTLQRSDPWVELSACVFKYHPALRYDEYVKPEFGVWLQQFTTSRYNAYILQQCVVHCLSKAMVEGKVPAPGLGSSVVCLREGLRLRQQMGLHEIPIKHNALILKVLLDTHQVASMWQQQGSYQHMAPLYHC